MKKQIIKRKKANKKQKTIEKNYLFLYYYNNYNYDYNYR